MWFWFSKDTTFSKSLFSCFWHLVSLLDVSYLIEELSRYNYTDRCRIITTNKILIVTYISPISMTRGKTSTIEFRRALFVIFVRVQDPSAQTIDNNDFYLCTKPSFSWSCSHCPSFVCAHPMSQFIIRCLLLKLPSKTFRPSIKVFVKDHYLDCVLTFIQLLRIQKTPSQYFTMKQ